MMVSWTPVNHHDLHWLPGAHPPPQRVQVLSFRHTKFSKCSCLGGQCPPYEVDAHGKSGIRHWFMTTHDILNFVLKYKFENNMKIGNNLLHQEFTDQNCNTLTFKYSHNSAPHTFLWIPLCHKVRKKVCHCNVIELTKGPLHRSPLAKAHVLSIKIYGPLRSDLIVFLWSFDAFSFFLITFRQEAVETQEPCYVWRLSVWPHTASKWTTNSEPSLNKIRRSYLYINMAR